MPVHLLEWKRSWYQQLLTLATRWRSCAFSWTILPTNDLLTLDLSDVPQGDAGSWGRPDVVPLVELLLQLGCRTSPDRRHDVILLQLAFLFVSGFPWLPATALMLWRRASFSSSIFCGVRQDHTERVWESSSSSSSSQRVITCRSWKNRVSGTHFQSFIQARGRPEADAVMDRCGGVQWDQQLSLQELLYPQSPAGCAVAPLCGVT